MKSEETKLPPELQVILDALKASNESIRIGAERLDEALKALELLVKP